jgi:hypothetical protein
MPLTPYAGVNCGYFACSRFFASYRSTTGGLCPGITM